MFDWHFFVSILPRIAAALIKVTITVTICGMVVAIVLGLILELLRRVRFRVVSMPIRFIRDFVQNTPLLLQAIFVFYIFPQYGLFTLSPFVTGVIVIGIQYSTYLAEVYRAGIDAVPRGQWEAARSLNFKTSDTWRRVVLPQAIPPIFPAMGNYLISMFKDVPQLLVIGLLDMAGEADALGSEFYQYTEPFVAAGIFYVILSFLSSLGVRRLEARFGRLT